jgi:hypothetical protein
MNVGGKDQTTAVSYCIRVKGHLDKSRSAWFEGMTLNPLPDGFTLMTGMLRDQAALFGLLARVRDLGLELWTVERLER